MNREAIRQATEMLAGWRRTLILSHVRPDGDALGAMAALTRVIRADGRQAVPRIFDAVPHRYRFLVEDLGAEARPGGSAEPAEGFDGILIVDTCSWAQLEPAAELLRSSGLPRIVVDHHATRDDVSGGAPCCALIDPAASSACLLVFEWLTACSARIDPAGAEALLAGMASDTGWFRYSGVDARTFSAAARLLDLGVRPDVLHARLYASFRAARLRLTALALSTLELPAGGRLAVMSLTQEMFRQAGAEPGDSEDLVNEPLSAEGVVASVLLVEQPDRRVRVNFRSKSPEVAGCDIDVAAVARGFGGGGHRRAAGATLDGPLDSARKVVAAATLAAMGQGA